MKEMLRSKRGSASEDTIYIIMAVAAFIVGMVFFTYIFTTTFDIMDTSLNTTIDDEVYEQTTGAFSIVDKLFMILFVILVISAIVGAFLVDIHPVFFVVSLVVLIMFIAFTGLITNTLVSVLTNDILNATYNSFPLMKFYIEHLPLIALIVAGLIIGALFTKPGTVLKQFN